MSENILKYASTMKNYTRKNLMIVFWHLGIGGIQKKIVDIARSKEANRLFNIHIVVKNKPHFTLEQKSLGHHTTIHYQPKYKYGIKIFFPLYILWNMLRLTPISVLTFLDRLSFYTIIASKTIFWRKQRIVINEDTISSRHTEGGLNKLCIRLLYPHAMRIICPTQEAKKDLENNFKIPEQKISVLPNWTITIPRRQRSKTWDIVYVGRFSEQKNLEFLIAAAEKIKIRHPALSICLVGEGDQEQYLRSLIHKKRMVHNVTIKHSSHNITDIFSRSTIFTLTSHYEGMSVAILEALRAGKIIVTTEFPGIHEYLTDKVTGFTESSMDSYVHRVINILDHPTSFRRIQRAAEKNAQERFGKKAMQTFFYHVTGETS